MNIKKYYINYGGSIAEDVTVVSIETLPIAKAIYEFKAGKYALPMVKKAVNQLSYNKEKGKTGLYNLKDQLKTKKFKTDDTTKEIIVVYNNDHEYFLPIFLEANSEKKIIIDVALNNLHKDVLITMKSFVSEIDRIIDEFSSNENKEFIVYEKDEFKKIKESNLYIKFLDYKFKLDEVTNIESLKTFLQGRINHRLLILIQERERILTQVITSEDYNLIFDIYKMLKPDSKEIRGKRYNRVLREVKNAIETNYIINNDHKIMILNENIAKLKYQIETNDKIPPSIKEVMRNKITNLEEKIVIRTREINIEIEIQRLNLFFYSDIFRYYNEIDNEIHTLLYTDKDGGSKIGLEFEKLISDDPDMQLNIINHNLAIPVEGIESIKTYFSYTHGNSDIDMAFVQ